MTNTVSTTTEARLRRLQGYGIANSDEERALRQKLKDFYERTLEEGQATYFVVRDKHLILSERGRYWMPEHQQVFRRLLNLQPTERFLDVGCGEGYQTIPLAREAGYSVGVDVAGSVLRVLQSLKEYDPSKLELIEGDVEDLPLPDASFDKVLCSHVLEHVLDDRAVLSEIRRVLVPGGTAVLAIPLKYTWQHRALTLATDVGRAILKPGKKKAPVLPPGTLNKRLIGRQAHIRHHSVDSFLDLVKSEGFAVEEIVGMWFHDPRNWVVRWTQTWEPTYRVGTRISKVFPKMGAGLVVLVRKKT